MDLFRARRDTTRALPLPKASTVLSRSLLLSAFLIWAGEWDTDRSGSIDKREFGKGMRALGTPGGSRTKAYHAPLPRVLNSIELRCTASGPHDRADRLLPRAQPSELCIALHPQGPCERPREHLLSQGQCSPHPASSRAPLLTWPGLSADEASKTEVDAIFDSWDADKSGSIDLRELNKLLRTVCPSIA